ncbi:uncharacterized protein LOC106673148 isoform X3 [Cimex lectularius]|uniref:Uncharacterized protein n=1 Tax=Cimex lectularius TaxID=79782 RepID=A0A8I6SAP2_CIMLE|nr:uncharacterized protein LOC106673148 isoform X3 [Cimex lectularius]
MHFIVLNRLFIRPSAIIRAVSAKWKSSENSLVNLTFGAVMDLDKDSVLRPTSDAATQCFQTSREESMFVCRQCFSGPESDGEEEQPSVESDPPPSNSQDEVCLVAPAPVVIGKRSTHEDLDPNRELKKVRFCLTDRQFGKTSFRLFLR